MAMSTRIEELYARYIKPLPPEDRLRLLALIARDLAEAARPTGSHERSLLELAGLGAELWRDVDAQEYVRELRREWDHRP
jgi:hypothetical protein